MSSLWPHIVAAALATGRHQRCGRLSAYALIPWVLADVGVEGRACAHVRRWGHGAEVPDGVEMVGNMVLVALPAPIAAGRATITVERARTAGRAAILRQAGTMTARNQSNQSN